MSIFGLGKEHGPTRINQVQLNQSVLGFALPVVMGKAKVQQSLLWVDGFTFHKVSVSNQGGGKGIGGGKGATQYVYSADVIAGLCNGGDAPGGGANVIGIGDVWSNQSWLSTSAAAESVTIGNGSDPTYTPINQSNFAIDLGVSVASGYSASYYDVAAPGPTVLAGTDVVPFRGRRKAPDPDVDPLGAGEYYLDNNYVYHFAPVDAGRTVSIGYAFALGTIKQQQTDLIPAGLTISVGGNLPFYADGGVIYKSGANIGKSLTKVFGTPSVAGTYSVSGSAPATYHFAAADSGVEVLITYQLNNSTAIPQGTPSSLGFQLFRGGSGQAPWATLASLFPGAAIAYNGIAYVAYGPMNLGYGAQIQQNTFEVMTADAYGGGIPDCSPVQCILQVLTNKVWGLGTGPVPFPASAIDNGAGGTWGKAQTGGARAADSTAWSWFASNGFFISPVIDKQETAASIVSRWLEAGACAAFMSEGLLKLVPYGDTSTAGNGATWIAPSQFDAALDDTCFLSEPGKPPVKVSSSPWQDAYNTVQVQWNNRQSQYAPEVTPDFDQAAINRYGQRIEDPQTWPFITTLPSAQFAASMRVKRNTYTRNTYQFRLPSRYSYLEPMSVVEITTSSAWAVGSNNILNIVNKPVRIIKTVDDPIKGITVTAEDYPFGSHQAVKYNKALAAAQVQPNLYADPGNSEVVLFEAPSRLTGFQGNQLWIGALGSSANWGSCRIHVSMDGNTYKQVGEITSPARLGTIGADFPSGADPDTVNSLVINLVENAAALDSATQADADIDNTLCYVGGELVSTSTLALTGQDQYTASGYIRRGRKGSTIAAHTAGALFMRLDDAIFKYTYDPDWAGKTIYLKFQSVNSFGNAAQDLSTLIAVTFTIPGLNPGTIDASTGLLLGAARSIDNLTDGTTFVRTPSLVGTNLVDNPTFEASASLVNNAPPGWSNGGFGTGGGGTCSYETASPYSGAQSVKFVTTSQYGGMVMLKKYAVSPGQTYRVSAAIKTLGGVNASVQMWCLDGSQGWVATLGCNSSSATWQLVSSVVTIPANAVIAYIATGINGASGGTAWFDNLEVMRIAEYSDGTIIDSLKPAEVGADVTAGKSIDVLTDGVTYGRPVISRLSAGKPFIDFSENIHLNKTADYIPESLTRKWAAESGADVTAGKSVDVLTDGNVYTRSLAPRTAVNIALNCSIIDAGAGTLGGRGPFAPSIDSAGQSNNWTCLASSLPTSIVLDLGALYYQSLKVIINSYFVGDNRFTASAGSIDISSDNSTWTIGVGSWSGAATDPIAVNLTNGTGRYIRINFTGGPLNPQGTTPTVNLSGCAVYGYQGSARQHLDTDVIDGITYGRTVQSRLSAGKPLIDFSENIHLNKNIDNVGDGTSYKRIEANSVDGVGRPLIDFSLGGHSNKTADYIAETAGRKYAAESGADITSNHTAADTANVNGLPGARVTDVVLDNSGTGGLRPVRFNNANVGLVTPGASLGSGTVSASGWQVAATLQIDVPAGTTQIRIQMTLRGTGASGSPNLVGFTGPDNVGFSITSGPGPSTPQATAHAPNGSTWVDVVLNNPTTGTGLTLTIYGGTATSGTGLQSYSVLAQQTTTTPYVTGAIA